MESSIDDEVIKCHQCWNPSTGETCKYFMPLGPRGRLSCQKSAEAYMKYLVKIERDKYYGKPK